MEFLNVNCTNLDFLPAVNPYNLLYSTNSTPNRDDFARLSPPNLDNNSSRNMSQ